MMEHSDCARFRTTRDFLFFYALVARRTTKKYTRTFRLPRIKNLPLQSTTTVPVFWYFLLSPVPAPRKKLAGLKEPVVSVLLYF